MKFKKFFVFGMILLLISGSQIFAWEQTFYNQIGPSYNRPSIDVRVFFGVKLFGKNIGYWKTQKNISNFNIIKGKAADCLVHIEVRKSGDKKWIQFKDLKTTGGWEGGYINRCGNNTLYINQNPDGWYLEKKDSHGLGRIVSKPSR
ncbi:MAG: hypothetical protein WDZ41_00435 [Candidatus Babeliales bacterium]